MTTTTTDATIPKRKGRPKGSESLVLHQNVVKVKQSVAGISNNEVAKIVGCQPRIVSDILAKYSIDKKDLDGFRDNQADILLGLQGRIVANISNAKLEKASAKDLAICMGIAVEKHRLITGQSTSNIASWSTVVQQAQAKTVDTQTVDR